ncbi:Uncharacterized protein BCZB5J_05094 [Bacillus cereus]|nr:Uncharacterized protein BCZB5J_05094 [Bacillus cereus]
MEGRVLAILDDLTGKKFGRLTVVERDKNIKKGTYWICNCDCGTNGKTVNAYSLKNGKTISCGCYNIEVGKKRLQDLTGKKFGRLLVLERDNSKKKTYWICKCECGSRVSVNAYELTHEMKLSCGCIRREKYDLTGKIFGRLTVVGKSSKRGKNGDMLWECECSCGTKNLLHTRNNLLRTDGFKTVSCGCYRTEGLHVKNREEDREKHIIKFLYGKLKIRNKNKGFNNDEIISLEVYKDIIIKPCKYCGIEKSNTTNDTKNNEYNYKIKERYERKKVSEFIFYHNGVDRIDSSKGYVIENVVPCCKYCNMAKMDNSEKVFLEWAESVYKYYILKE